MNYTHHVPPPCHESIDVLHADDHVIVVAKPAGLLSVPGRIVKDCVIQRLQFDYPDVVAVHRLDLDTSGLIVFAQTKLAVSELNRQFRDREIDKRYEAVVAGQLAQASGVIELAMRPDPDNRPRQLIDEAGGKASTTIYSVLNVESDRTRVELTPVTGRSHQLRLHLSAIGHPILGCDLYADDTAYRAAPRLLLHARALAFRHPSTGEALTFGSEVPF